MHARTGFMLGILSAVLGYTAHSTDEPGHALVQPIAAFHDSINPARCPLPSAPGPGTHVMWVEHEGMTRTYAVHVPGSHDPAVPAPVVVSLHGFARTALDHASLSGLSDLADSEGFVALYPAGFEGSWNAGDCCGAAAVANVDDVGFVIAAIRDAASRMCVDTERIYLMGTSNGGALAHRLACEASDLFAAVSVVSSEMPASMCMPSRPLPMIAFHDAMAEDVPYESGEEGFLTWAWLNECTGSPSRTAHGGSFCDTYETCSGGTSLSFCTVDPVTRSWPDGDATGCSGLLGPCNHDIDVGLHAWTFLSRHALR
jgi:polyhydroxybutyrate depolymerase